MSLPQLPLPIAPRGRGTGRNPENRFERIHVEYEPDGEQPVALPTVFYRDASRTILAENESPDVGFRFSLNPYRGCEHGCVYCYARPSHEYLSFSAGLDFETRILVKPEAPALLRAALASARWKPQAIALSGNTDCYQPAERQLRLTRRCLEVLRDFRNPVTLVTKSALVTRDVDLLADLAAMGAAHVHISVTTLDPELAARLEPRAARPARRLEAVATLARAGIPVGVFVAPVIPGLTDWEIPAILRAAADAGARAASWMLLRLPPPVDALFEEWLARWYPERRQRVLGRTRQCRGGLLNDSRFGRRMRGEGAYAEHIEMLFAAEAKRLRLPRELPPLSAAHFRRARESRSESGGPVGAS